VKDSESLLYRVYQTEENILFAWTLEKSLIKAFFKQRTPNKYYYTKSVAVPKVSDRDPEIMLQILKLKSNQTGGMIPIVTTENEKRAFELDVHSYFQDLCSLHTLPGKHKDISKYIMMIINLDERFLDALTMIGYRPPEIESIFDSLESHHGMMDTEAIKAAIDDAHQDWLTLSWEERPDTNDCITSAYFLTDDPSRMLIYSFEAFVKIMIDNF
jgi:hypothetical protein